MEEKQIRIDIINTCLFLKRKGLIARTWGNVSARLNENEFIITPSGIDYEDLRPEDLVVVKIKDCSYDHTQKKPSSEKLVHAYAYKTRSDINFVIHTHQHYASAVSADEFSTTLSDGSFVPCIEYGLPSTKKLAKNCLHVFKKFQNCNAFLMAKHGALIFGSTITQAQEDAIELENACKEVFRSRVNVPFIPKKMEPYLDDYAQMFPLDTSEDRETILMLTEKNADASLYATNSKPLSKLDCFIQHFIYKFKYSKLRNK